ncbi:MAG: CHAT domain-containing protein [Saprospiraceae bacterium]|nr:CHAT domain-containing protein [Saprospiraceae bacterium]
MHHLLHSLRIGALLFFSSLSLAIQAQSPLEEALNTYRFVDWMLINNPNALLPPPILDKMNAAIGVLDSAGRRFEQGSLLFYKANMAGAHNRPHEVLPYLDSARVVLESNQDESVSRLVNARLGNVWNEYSLHYDIYRFDFEKALQAWQKSNDYFMSADMPERLVETVSNKSITLSRFGKGSQALDLASEALLIYNRLDATQLNNTKSSPEHLHYMQGVAHQALADSLYYAGHWQQMEEHIEIAIRHYDEVKSGEKVASAEAAMAWYGKGVIYLRSKAPGALDSAYWYISEVGTVLANNLEFSKGMVPTLQGVIRYRQGNKDLGMQLVVEGLNALGYPVKGFFDTNTTVKAESNVYLIQTLIAKINLLELDYHQSADPKLLEQLIFDAEQVASLAEVFLFNYQDRISRERLSYHFGFVYANAVNVAAELYRISGNEALKERAFRLAELGRAMSLRYQISKTMLSDEAGQRVRKESLENNIYAISEVQQIALPRGTAAIAFSSGLNQMTAMVMTSDEVRFVSLPGIRIWSQDLARLLSYYEFGDLRYNEGSKQLYELLLKPVINTLPSNTEHLIIVPDDLLWRINFDALVTEQKGKTSLFLVEKYAISLSYGLQITTSLAERHTRSNRTSLNAFTGKYPSEKSLPELDAASLRVTNSWMKAARYPETDKETFCRVFPSAELTFLAAHGIVADGSSPEHFYIEFSEGERLYLNEIYAMEMGTPSAARLVFLASCLTARGESIRGEGISSIARAFHYIGIPALITPYSNIKDGPSAEIAVTFFEGIKNGKSAVQALREAKIRYIKQNNRPAPRLWAPLVCVGYGNIRF